MDTKLQGHFVASPSVLTQPMAMIGYIETFTDRNPQKLGNKQVISQVIYAYNWTVNSNLMYYIV